MSPPPGLSENPLEQGLLRLPYLPASLIFLLLSFFEGRAFFFSSCFSFCGPVFFACTSILSSIYRKHSAAQRNQPACTKQQSKYVPIRARQREQAGRVARSSILSIICYTARGVIKANGHLEICSAYKNIQPITKQCDARRISLYFQSH